MIRAVIVVAALVGAAFLSSAAWAQVPGGGGEELIPEWGRVLIGLSAALLAVVAIIQGWRSQTLKVLTEELNAYKGRTQRLEELLANEQDRRKTLETTVEDLRRRTDVTPLMELLTRHDSEARRTLQQLVPILERLEAKLT